MTTRTPGQAAFEGFERRRYPIGQRTPWRHPSVNASREAWEAGGEAAIELCAEPALAATYAAWRKTRHLLRHVRTILANGELSAPEARQAAVEVIQQAEPETVSL